MKFLSDKEIGPGEARRIARLLQADFTPSPIPLLPLAERQRLARLLEVPAITKQTVMAERQALLNSQLSVYGLS